MRGTIVLACLFFLPSATRGQVGPMSGPDPAPYGRGSVFAGPYTGYAGDMAPSVPRTTTTGYVWNNRPEWRSTGPVRRQAGYFYYPYYPGLRYSNPPDIRPQRYVVPPVRPTPYHDPFFEERFWEDVAHGRDVYEYWGW